MNKDILNRIDKAEIISFDIFDTLLIRPYMKPVDLFLHLEKLYDAQGFQYERIKAEQRARDKYSNKEDITFNQIYDEIDGKYTFLKLHELDLEKQVLTVIKSMKEVYDYAIAQGKKVVITSDMYLPKGFLLEILEKNGIKDFSNFYVSSEVLKTKHTGSLFNLILDDFNCQPSDILHIGDNYHADYSMAINAGLNAIHINNKHDLLLQQNDKAKIYYEQHGHELGCSIILGVLSMLDISKQEDYWKHIGFNYAGPAIYAYVKWLDNEFLKQGIETALFVARDGYSLQKVFEIIKQSNAKSYYLYAPRILNLTCFLDYQGRVELNKNEGLSAVSTILTYFKDKDDFLKINTPNITNLNQGVKFIEDNYAIYKSLADLEKKQYEDYLATLDINDKNVALIDTIGYFLTAQKFLSKLFTSKLSGFYWLLAPRTSIEAKIFNLNEFEDGVGVLNNWDLMELFMTSPEAPIRGLKDGKPIYKTLAGNEQFRSRIYPSISDGIIEFAKYMQSIFANYETFIYADEIILWENIFCTNPDIVDKTNFNNIHYAWDPAHEKYTRLFESWYVASGDVEEVCFNDGTIHNKEINLFGRKIITIKKSPFQKEIYLFQGEIFRRKKTNTRIRYYLLKSKVLSLRAKSKHTSNEINKIKANVTNKYYLFGFLPLWKIKYFNYKTEYFLFGFIRVLKTKIRHY